MMAPQSYSLAQQRALADRRAPHSMCVGLAHAHADEPRSHVARALDRAAELVDADPDAAALLLDGVLWRLAEEWYAQQRLAAPDARHLLPDLERRCAPLAWLMRVALRAPDVRARLAHAQGLAGAMLSERRSHARAVAMERASHIEIVAE